MSHDTVLHRLVRPVVHGAARWGVTPDQLTWMRLATGLAAGLAFAHGGARWPDIGAGVMLASLLLDRADGELARHTGQTSRRGYRLDLACDCAATAAGFIGMGVGSRAVLGPAAPWLGVVAGVCVVVMFWQINVASLALGKSVADRSGRVLFDPDDAMLGTPILIWCGWMPAALGLAALATPVAVISLAALALRRAARMRSLARRQA